MSTLTHDQLLAKTIYLTQENNRLREELLDAQVRLGLIALAPSEEQMTISAEPLDQPAAPGAHMMSIDEAAEHFSNGEAQ